MNEVVFADPEHSDPKNVSRPWFDRREGRMLAVVGATVILTLTALSRSFLDGRLANPLTHNDVNYFIDGIQHLVILRKGGMAALIDHFTHDFMHAPISTYQAMLAYLLFGIHDWAPYASNIVYAAILLGFATYLLRGCPNIIVTAALAFLISMPLCSNMITEFAPETVASLFTAIAVVLTLNLPLLDAPLRPRIVAGLCFGVGYLAHPVAFAFTTIALLATIGLVFLREIILSGRFDKFGTGILQSLLNVLLSVWLPALYMVPWFKGYWDYFYEAILNSATASFYAPPATLRENLRYFLFGGGGQFMFGDQFWAYAGIILLGFVVSFWDKRGVLLIRQTELLALALIFLLVPSIPRSTNYLFAQAFGFSIALLIVMAVRSIYETVRSRTVAAVLLGAGLLLLCFGRSHYFAPNTSRDLLDRQFAFRAIDRFKADLIGNSAQDDGVRVYSTSFGLYAPNILQYYLLKTDPSLDWVFQSKFPGSNPRDHLDYIREWQPNFVIAGERNSGFTNNPYAAPTEDTTLAAMWHDNKYMAIDRFYGPHGRTVTVFERRVKFGGWRPIAGIRKLSEAQDSPRLSTGNVSYLRTFAPRPVQATLQIECSGTVGQSITVRVNQQEVGEMKLGSNGRTSLDQKIDLQAEQNDIVFKYSSAERVTFHRLLIIPQIAQEDRQ